MRRQSLQCALRLRRVIRVGVENCVIIVSTVRFVNLVCQIVREQECTHTAGASTRATVSHARALTSIKLKGP